MLLRYCLLFLPGVLFAQEDRKGSYFRADGYFVGKRYDKAREEIERVIADPKKADRADVWYLRGRIYQAILTDPAPEVQALSPDAHRIAKDSFSRVIAMQGRRNSRYTNAVNSIQNVYSFLFNKGVDAYTTADYEGAYDYFNRALDIKPHDQTILSYVALAAQQCNMTDRVFEIYYKMVDLGTADEDTYSWLIYQEGTVRKDEEQMQQILRQARERFPENADFLKEEINMLVRQDAVDEAEKKLVEAIEKEPTNPLLYLNLAIIYDNKAVQSSEDKAQSKVYLETAKTYYEKTLAIDPDHFVANYNLGVVYANFAKEYYDQVRKMDIQTYYKTGAKIQTHGDEIMIKGLPYLEKAYTINPDDQDVIVSLYQVYVQMGRKEDAEKMQGKIK